MKQDLKRLDAKYEVKQKKGVGAGTVLLIVIGLVIVVICFAAIGLAP